MKKVLVANPIGDLVEKRSIIASPAWAEHSLQAAGPQTAQLAQPGRHIARYAVMKTLKVRWHALTNTNPCKCLSAGTVRTAVGCRFALSVLVFRRQMKT
jgi:hypothetical protein